ncbi:hypothetical protein DPMN_042774 [Dreissena polymorpha]|uniref:Uncharacterized protein n=1 Tax=Dreissena polymorpha TaxID=45954 RepID=A0A9D4HZ25_DREPO|nr:hypothetical protein DPMN_042774 [Dreissena polymorpha]
MPLSFANEERYLLQLTKTVALNIKPSRRATIPQSESFKLGEIDLNSVDTSVHLGITRKTSVCETVEVNVETNISKARRVLYSLLGAGLHGHNGLDHKSMLDLHSKEKLLNIYVFTKQHCRPLCVYPYRASTS